jgi:hypothetical protein
MADSIKKLSFLIGEWNGKGEGFDTGKDSNISNILSFNYHPSPSIITGRFEARREGKPENEGMMFLLYDPNIGKYVRKQVYSYGFVMNEVGQETNEDLFVFDCVSIDAEPDYWKGLRIRSFLQKHSDREIAMGLQTAKKSEDFHTYGQNRFRKIT